MRGIRLVSAAFVLLVVGAAGSSAATNDRVIGLSLDGVVDPFSASYLSGSIEDAQQEDAAAVLITIDTPGGLSSSMREIVQSILNSDVPVLCYVSPAGARAASAGAFILLSCDVAAMAPGTNVGAASPVGVSGVIEQRKALNDSAAYIRSIAEEKGRNPDWAESAVREAASATAEEALELGVVDAIHPSVAAFLADADGTTIEKNGRSLTIETADASVSDRDMGFGFKFLHALLTPDLAFLFFFLGIGLIILEVIHPGISVPGILGVLSLVAAFASFGMLPVELIGIILLVASAGFFLLELKHPGVGVAGISAIVGLIAGGLLLFDRSVPGVGVSLWLILPVAGLMGAFFLGVAPAALKARRLPVTTGLGRLIGQEGVVVADLSPHGTVHVGAELWTAESLTGTVFEGEPIRVVSAEGLRLKVEAISEMKKEEQVESTGGGS